MKNPNFNFIGNILTTSEIAELPRFMCLTCKGTGLDDERLVAGLTLAREGCGACIGTGTISMLRCEVCEKKYAAAVVHRCGSPRSAWNLANGRAFVDELVNVSIPRWGKLNGAGAEAAVRYMMMDWFRQDWIRWLGRGRADELHDLFVANTRGIDEDQVGKNTSAHQCAAAASRAIGLRVPRSDGAWRACMEALRRWLSVVEPDAAHVVDGLDYDLSPAKDGDVVGMVRGRSGAVSFEDAVAIHETLRFR